MLAVNPRTTWTWPQQSPSPTNDHSTKRRIDTRGSTSNTKTSFSDHRNSKGRTRTEKENNKVRSAVVGRRILPSAGGIFHDQLPCEPSEDAEPASKVSRITSAESTDFKMNLNCIKSGNNTSPRFINNNNAIKSSKPSNSAEKRKMWLKRKKKLNIQNGISENNKAPLENLPPVFSSSPNVNNYSVSNNIDSIEIVERNGYNNLWTNSSVTTTPNPFANFHELTESEVNSELNSLSQLVTQYKSHNYTNSCENDESAKNRLLDIVLSDKECAVDNQTNQSKHASAIKGESNLKKGGGRLIFVKKATNNFYYRPSSSPKKLNNENDEKLTHKNKLSDLNKSININPTNIATENVEYFNITTPKPEKCQTVNYEKSDEENIEKDGFGFFKRGTSALSSLRKSLKRKLNPSSNVQNIPSNTLVPDINTEKQKLFTDSKKDGLTSKDEARNKFDAEESMEVEVNDGLTDHFSSRLKIVEQDKPAKIPNHLSGVGSCDTSQDSGLGEDSDHNSSYTAGNAFTTSSPRKPSSLNLQTETSANIRVNGDPNGSRFSSAYPTPILRPPTLSFRDSTCSSNLSSFCSSSKKHVVIQEPNMNKIHQFSPQSPHWNHDYMSPLFVKEEEEDTNFSLWRYNRPETPIQREVVSYRDVPMCCTHSKKGSKPVKYSVTDQWNRIYRDAEEEVIQRLEKKFCHVRSNRDKTNTLICDKALKSGSCGKGFHRYVDMIFVDSTPPSSSTTSSSSLKKSILKDGQQDLTSFSSSEISQLVDVLYQILFYDGWIYSPRDTIIVHCVQRFLIVVIDVCCQELDIDVRLKLAKDFRYLLKESEQEHYKDLKKIVKQTQILYIQLWCSLLCVPFQPKKNCFNNTGQISGQFFGNDRIKCVR